MCLLIDARPDHHHRSRRRRRPLVRRRRLYDAGRLRARGRRVTQASRAMKTCRIRIAPSSPLKATVEMRTSSSTAPRDHTSIERPSYGMSERSLRQRAAAAREMCGARRAYAAAVAAARRRQSERDSLGVAKRGR